MKNQHIFDDDKLLSKLTSLTDDDNTLHLLGCLSYGKKALWTMDTQHLSKLNIDFLIEEFDNIVFAGMTGKQLLINFTKHDKAHRMFWHEELEWLTEKMKDFSQTKVIVHNLSGVVL